MNASTSHMHQVQINKSISAPLKDTWAVIADFNNVYTWAPSVEHSEALNEKSQTAGAGRVCSIKGFGDIEEQILEWNDGKSLAFTISNIGPLVDTVCRFEVKALGDNQTLLTVTLRYNLRFGAIGKLIHALILGKKLKTSFGHTVEALKTRVETGKLLRPYKSLPETLATSS